ncbi:hypothetical protein Tco_0912225 [Tanacetum coccineum]
MGILYKNMEISELRFFPGEVRITASSSNTVGGKNRKKTNTDCLVKEQEKVHLGIKVGANITVTGVPGQEGAEGNVAEKKKRVHES